MKTLLCDHAPSAIKNRQKNEQIEILQNIFLEMEKMDRKIWRSKSLSGRGKICGLLFIRSYKPRWDISWYNCVTVYNKSTSQVFVATTLALHFSVWVFTKTLYVLSSICQIKIFKLPTSFIVYVWPFEERKVDFHYLWLY